MTNPFLALRNPSNSVPRRVIDYRVVIFLTQDGHICEPHVLGSLPPPEMRLMMTWSLYHRMAVKDTSLNKRVTIVGGTDIWAEECDHVDRMWKCHVWPHTTCFVTNEHMLTNIRRTFRGGVSHIQVVIVGDDDVSQEYRHVNVEFILGIQGFIKDDSSWVSTTPVTPRVSRGVAMGRPEQTPNE